MEEHDHDHDHDHGHDHDHPHPHQHPQQQQMMQQGPAPPTPTAIAIANFLKNADLKPRTSILGGKRVDMFKVKRAIRALESPAYQKAQKKNNSNLPPVSNRQDAEMTFLTLPRHMMALRVAKIDAEHDDSHAGHGHGKPKRIKGQWNVQIVPQQAAQDDMYYVWLYEGPQWKRTIIGIVVLICLLGIVMFPLWPAFLKLGVWYLSMGMLGLLGLFFAMAIFRLILFVITMFAVPPGLWLYPNLFEDVGFFDSFRPVWAWEEVKGKKKKKPISTKPVSTKKAKKAKAEGQAHDHAHEHDHEHHDHDHSHDLDHSEVLISSENPESAVVNRNLQARIEEVEED